MSEKKRCVDEYGNPANGLATGAVVESDLAIFTVGKINSHNWLVVMDKDKPYKIKDKNNPMAKCVESGHYAVYAGYLCFSSLECETSTDSDYRGAGVENLKYIKSHIAECERRIETVKQFIKTDKNADIDGCIENIRIWESVISALEKQIPQKPKKDDKQVMRYTTVYVCPSCGGVFSGTLSQYCYHCGQMLDWNDNE